MGYHGWNSIFKITMVSSKILGVLFNLLVYIVVLLSSQFIHFLGVKMAKWFSQEKHRPIKKEKIVIYC